MEDPTRKDIREINYKIEDIEKSVGLLLRGRRKEVITELMATCFKNSAQKAKVFLAIDGESSVGDLAFRLGIKRPNVSLHIADLLEHDLIAIRTTEGGRVIYEKTSQVKRLKLEEFLIETFGKSIIPPSKETTPTGQAEGSNAGESGGQSSDTVTSA
jgi:DNA-binding transcriptional ArsR family regulator